jgi:hypothetical protein
MRRGPPDATSKLVIVTQPATSSSLSPYALDRGLREYRLGQGTTRILLCEEEEKDALFSYRYQMPGHGWVRKLKDRPLIPLVADPSKLISQLSPSGTWKASGGLTGICQTTRPVNIPPDDVATMLYKLVGSDLP